MAGIPLVAMLWGGLGLAVLTGAVVGIPLLIYSMTNLSFGIGILLFLAFFINFFNKFLPIPFGILLDVFSTLLFFVVIARNFQSQGWAKFYHPLSLVIVLWVLFGFISFLNPIAPSQMAWVYSFRAVFLLYIIYFVAVEVITSYERLRNFLYFIVGMGLLTALYGLKQEFFGFMDMELEWLSADSTRFHLIVQWGRYRIFSFCSDPTTFGTLMAFLGIFSLVISLGHFHMRTRIIAFLISVVMFVAILYCGSRTPFLLVPVGMAMYLILNFRPQVLLSIFGLVLFTSAILLVFNDHPVVHRVLSAFQFWNLDSMQVRLQNQAYIQSFIKSNPFGGGMGSTGIWGQRFSPHNWLSNFAHDSGYVRTAVELGWIGLLLYSVLLFTTMRYAIKYSFEVEDPKIRDIYHAVTSSLFVLLVGSYAQELYTLLPISIIYYFFLGIIVRAKDLNSKTEQL